MTDYANRQLVPDDGPLGAPIVIIGEADAKHEMAARRHFVGPAGRLLSKWMAQAGLQRSDAYFTNVIPYQVNAKNDLSLVSDDEKAYWTKALHERLRTRLRDPHVFVPLGNLALGAVTGLQGITRYRGYFCETRPSIFGEPRKAIPSIHPAATFYQAAESKTSAPGQPVSRRTWKVRCQADWHRIAAERHSAATALPKREQYIRPTFDDLEWLESEVDKAAKHPGALLMFDIETPRWRAPVRAGTYKNGKPKWKSEWGPRHVGCVGFAICPSWAMSIPTTLGFWGSQKKLDKVWALIRRLLTRRDIDKGTNRGVFDYFYLGVDHHIPPVRWTEDCQARHHLLDPIEQHSLEYQASRYLRTTYWKDEGKGEDGDAFVDFDRWSRYNCKDAHHQWELIDVYRRSVFTPDQEALYRRSYPGLLDAILDTMVRGVPIDETVRKQRLIRNLSTQVRTRKALTEFAGADLFGKTDLSQPKLKAFLYGTLGLPARAKRDRKTGKVSVTTRDVDLRRLALAYPDRAAEPVRMIQAVRAAQKAEEFYAESLVDPDGRSRCEYWFAETWRLRSYANPKSSKNDPHGRDHQNFARAERSHVVPDPGCLMLKIDLSQAENREIYAETGDPELVRLARLPPWEYDDHRAIAAACLRKSEADVTKAERQLFKTINHAALGGMQEQTLADQLIGEGIPTTIDECRGYLADYFSVRTAVKTQYFRRVRKEIVDNHRLVGSRGFVWDVSEERIDDALFRRGYRFYPQHEVGVLGWEAYVAVRRWLRGKQSRCLIEMHDEIIASVTAEDAWSVVQIARHVMEAPHVYHGTELSIPVGVTLCSNYSGLPGYEWKRPPSEADFMEQFAELHVDAYALGLPYRTDGVTSPR